MIIFNTHSESFRLKKNAPLMCCAAKTFVFRVEQLLIFFYSLSFPSFMCKKWRSPSRRVEKIKGRSTQDINDLGSQHIKGPFYLLGYMLFFL